MGSIIKEISPNNFAGKKDLSNFFTYNSSIVEVDDVEYVYELNGVNFKGLKDTDLAFAGIWRITGIIKNEIKLSYNINIIEKLFG